MARPTPCFSFFSSLPSLPSHHDDVPEADRGQRGDHKVERVVKRNALHHVDDGGRRKEERGDRRRELEHAHRRRGREQAPRRRRVQSPHLAGEQGDADDAQGAQEFEPAEVDGRSAHARRHAAGAPGEGQFQEGREDGQEVEHVPQGKGHSGLVVGALKKE